MWALAGGCGDAMFNNKKPPAGLDGRKAFMFNDGLANTVYVYISAKSEVFITPQRISLLKSLMPKEWLKDS